MNNKSVSSASSLIAALSLTLSATAVAQSATQGAQATAPGNISKPAENAKPAAEAGRLDNGLPLWELGISAFALGLPDYRGSDETSAYVAPLPYVIYRGKRLRADRGGIRGELFETDRVQLDVSFGGAVPVRAGKNKAREGMARLDPSVEVGPSLIFTLLRSENRRTRVDLRLPVRAAIALDTDTNYYGLIASPSLAFVSYNIPALGGWGISTSIGPQFGTRGYHDYFYTVAPRFATATRPAYQASGGYGGSGVVAAAFKGYGNWQIFLFGRADTLKGAAFEDSPLVKSKNYWLAGGGVAYVFARSSERVPRID